MLDTHIAARSYIWVSSNYVARQPIVFVWIPIIIIIILPTWKSMAAHRTAWWKVVKFGTLVQDSPISPLSQSQVASPTALAPPTGQSWACIHVHNFRPILPIFTNQVSLDSLNQAQFNTPYDVIAPWRIYPPSWFMSKTFKVLLLSQILSNHLETWHTWPSRHASELGRHVESCQNQL